jgi:YfiR/HmsC-like
MSSSARASSSGRWLRMRAALRVLVALVSVGMTFTYRGAGQTAQLPIAVQADLMVKVAGFDRNFRSRAGGKVVVILAAASDDAAAMRPVMEMKSALARFSSIADLPHEEQVVTGANASTLASIARERHAAIVYLGPGYGGQIPAIREAFSSINVLTVGAAPDYVPAGVVLGFDLVSGRPKLLVHVPQARKQQVAFPASVLNLMKVYP